MTAVVEKCHWAAQWGRIQDRDMDLWPQTWHIKGIQQIFEYIFYIEVFSGFG